jgi:Zn-dependent peptidase ImmA (M78 family)
MPPFQNSVLTTQQHAKRAPREGFRNMESLGTILANRVLAEAPLRFQCRLSPMPLEHLAKCFSIKMDVADDNQWLAPLQAIGLEGSAIKTQTASDSDYNTDLFSSDYHVNILSQGFRSRFTLAHEIAHVVLSSEYGHFDKSLSRDKRERACDIAAAIMLCPEEGLIDHFQSVRSLTVDEIEKLAARMQISISLLVNRLRQLILRKAFSIDNIVLLVSLNRSRKRQENLAPRVASTCGPNRWFVPLNSRLSTIGLIGLQKAFYEAPLYFSGRTNEVMRLWDYDIGARTKLECDVKFKCYKWVRQKPSKETIASRIMLAVASREEGS